MSNSIPINSLRGASIGIVSGIKGGALSGLLGGGLIMFAAVSQANLGLSLLYTLLLAATTGSMAGATIGAALGAASGALSGRMHGRFAPLPIWLILFAAGGGTLGRFALPENRLLSAAVGLLLGLLAGWLAHRDFARMLTFQAADAELPPDLQKKRRGRKETD